MTELMKQSDFERLSSLMTDKGVVHEAFELLADLRQSEKMMKEKVDAIKYSIIDCLQPFTDFEGFSVSEVNYLQVIRKMKDQLRWRPVSEKPKESDRYIVKYRQGKIVKKFIADYDVVLGWNMPLPDVEILEYLPIPPAPEGE